MSLSLSGALSSSGVVSLSGALVSGALSAGAG